MGAQNVRQPGFIEAGSAKTLRSAYRLMRALEKCSVPKLCFGHKIRKCTSVGAGISGLGKKFVL